MSHENMKEPIPKREATTAPSTKIPTIEEVRQILMKHKCVDNVTVTKVKEDNGDGLLHANVNLNKNFFPSNELKWELAWSVGCESGCFAVFKDIEFRMPSYEVDSIETDESSEDRIIHIAGHQVLSSEVEQAIMDYPGVLNAKVIGVPDKRKGEILKAFVTLKETHLPLQDIEHEIAWMVQLKVGPKAVFKDIEFGDFITEPVQHKGTQEEVEITSIPEIVEHPKEGMVIVDEIKEEDNVIHISSHRISTTEITNCLLAHPYVDDAAVVTIPHEKGGEMMKAFVKLKQGIVPSNDLKLELAWHVMTDLKPISVFKSIELESTKPMTYPVRPESIPLVMKQHDYSMHGSQYPYQGAQVQTQELNEKVEHLLSNHAAVSEAIVISVPDKKHKEALQAFVTLKEGYLPSEELMEELAWHARTTIGSSVVFKSIKFRRFFPVTTSREKLESILKADTMEIPTMMSITIAD